MTDPGTQPTSLGVGVLTIAEDRTLESDEAGSRVVEGLESAGHKLVTREHIGPSYDRVQSTVKRLTERDDLDVLVTVGATGVDPTDVTIEAVRQLVDRELTGFGQLFTILGYERIGTGIVAGRTLAGMAEEVFVCCLPGHPDAAELAVEEIVRPEVPGIVATARGEGPSNGPVDADEEASVDEQATADEEASGDEGTSGDGETTAEEE